MQEFLYLFRNCEPLAIQASPEKWQEHVQKWSQWMGALNEQGKLIGGQPLDETGKTVTGTRKVVSDGPFIEGKEMIGGYLIVKAKDYEEAVNLSKGCPVLEFEDGIVEVRQIQELKM